ncbi:MAG TPA: peptidase, partial [Acidobacteriota bacterium]|nr:peptidase [Acidobacteriota bacterium]
MTEDQFTHLITRLEDLAQRHPVQYKLRVALVAMLGYAYMVLVLMVLAALIFLMMGLMPTRRSGDPAVYLAIKIGVVVFFLATVLMRAMWVKIPTPNGLKLTREQTPRLFHLVDELSKKLQTPRIHHILIDIEYNAAM